jgi:hypothetical protein
MNVRTLKLISYVFLYCGIGFLALAAIHSIMLNNQTISYLRTQTYVDKVIALQTLAINERYMQILPFVFMITTIGLFGVIIFETIEISEKTR